MSTVVGIMDREGLQANTDNLVLVDPQRRQLLWIPRDLWCDPLADRINIAFRAGGHQLLVSALRSHGVDADHSLVLSRTAVETALASVAVLVPIPARMAFAYPLAPTARIEDGSKEIAFNPPAEVLRGERVHQWLGARGGSDLHRLERQKVFVRRLLEQRFDFRRLLEKPDAWACSDPAALDELALVEPSWEFGTLGPMEPAVIDGKQILLKR